MYFYSVNTKFSCKASHFTGHKRWQQENSIQYQVFLASNPVDLRLTFAHLKQGTRPSKKLTKIKDIKRYLNVATIAKDGLLVVKRSIPLKSTRECIIVPRQVLDGLLLSLHIKLDHPSCYQLKQIVHRYFFALDMDKSIDQITSSCHICCSLKKVPDFKHEQSTGDSPEVVGMLFAADIMKRERQLILVLREYVISFTASLLLENERHESIREALLRLCIELRPLEGPPSVIHTDAAPGFIALQNDELLAQHHLVLEIGSKKNKNKNPVAEKAIQELEEEILKQEPLCRSVTSLLLSIATARLNTRIRNRGLSSREMWTKRDQFSNN